ncbi:MAG: metallophosphoesterase [Candidatus Eremiobacteraeota bacterium]|nr:metallophosphoesterase [Candidatus Eremiobacteraeota bacterium]
MILAAVLSAWLQYAADGEPHARAVVSDTACPSASVDGRALAMTERARREAQFADVVCDAAIPPRAKRIRIGDRELPAPVHDPRRVVVLGDTGCRISALSAQSCNDPAAWPFPQIAQAIAAVHPDLIVHVGDYLYRERACPVLARCADSPFGDDAAAWYADFLTPAAPLFAGAPLVLVRGNHEECARNGAGWFRYLDAHASSACSDATDPYEVSFGDLRIVAFDSAVAEDRGGDPARGPIYKRQFATVGEWAKRPDLRPQRVRSGQRPRESWFVTHRPPYTNEDERTAMGDALAPFDAVLAGHLHMFAAMNVTSFPPLLINGEGGAKLDPNYVAFLGFAVGDLHVQGSVFGSAHFGFGVYTRAGAGWTISLRDPDGTERARCTLANRTARCNSEK